jgi:hypothetical protein
MYDGLWRPKISARICIYYYCILSTCPARVQRGKVSRFIQQILLFVVNSFAGGGWSCRCSLLLLEACSVCCVASSHTKGLFYLLFPGVSFDAIFFYDLSLCNHLIIFPCRIVHWWPMFRFMGLWASDNTCDRDIFRPFHLPSIGRLNVQTPM